MRRSLVIFAVLLAIAAPAAAQMTYRLKGTVRDNDGQPVAAVRIHAEALNGYRGEPFAGQREFEVTTNDKGEWVVHGLTSGIWTFEATAPGVVPQVVVLPINFTNRKPQSAAGGSFSWDLPLRVRRTTNARLSTAAEMAMTQKDQAAGAIGTLAAEPNADDVCASGELALLIRQSGLARALFEQALKQQAKHACATLGMASAALMQNDYNTASKMLYTVLDLAPREQRPALGAAMKDLQAIANTK